jgi:hypothetical protein
LIPLLRAKQLVQADQQTNVEYIEADLPKCSHRAAPSTFKGHRSKILAAVCSVIAVSSKAYPHLLHSQAPNVRQLSGPLRQHVGVFPQLFAAESRVSNNLTFMTAVGKQEFDLPGDTLIEEQFHSKWQSSSFWLLRSPQ